MKRKTFPSLIIGKCFLLLSIIYTLTWCNYYIECYTLYFVNCDTFNLNWNFHYIVKYVWVCDKISNKWNLLLISCDLHAVVCIFILFFSCILVTLAYVLDCDSLQTTDYSGTINLKEMFYWCKIYTNIKNLIIEESSLKFMLKIYF